MTPENKPSIEALSAAMPVEKTTGMSQEPSTEVPEAEMAVSTETPVVEVVPEVTVESSAEGIESEKVNQIETPEAALAYLAVYARKKASSTLTANLSIFMSDFDPNFLREAAGTDVQSLVENSDLSQQQVYFAEAAKLLLKKLVEDDKDGKNQAKNEITATNLVGIGKDLGLDVKELDVDGQKMTFEEYVKSLYPEKSGSETTVETQVELAPEGNGLLTDEDIKVLHTAKNELRTMVDKAASEKSMGVMPEENVLSAPEAKKAEESQSSEMEKAKIDYDPTLIFEMSKAEVEILLRDLTKKAEALKAAFDQDGLGRPMEALSSQDEAIRGAYHNAAENAAQQYEQGFIQ